MKCRMCFRPALYTINLNSVKPGWGISYLGVCSQAHLIEWAQNLRPEMTGFLTTEATNVVHG